MNFRSHRLAILPLLMALQAIARAADAAVPVTFQLDWKPNAQFAGLILARERGWYREAGLDVNLLPVPPDEGVVSNVVAHPGWIGCAESGVLIAARARGQPIKVVGTMLQGTPICLMSLAKSAIRTPADLAGRRIGLHADGNDAIDYVLARNGLDRSRLRIEILPHDTTPLTEGRLDAVQGYAVDEAVELSLEGHALHLMFFHDHGYAAYAQAYFVSEQTLATRPETVRKFLAASRRGWIAATGERDAAVEYIATRTLPGSDRRHQRKALDAIVPLLTREGGPGSHGKMRKETWQAAVAAHNALPGAARKVSVGELVVFDP